jgi:hypothetical protein
MLMLELLMGNAQVLCAKFNVGIVLLALISRSIICPWHDTKAE